MMAGAGAFSAFDSTVCKQRMVLWIKGNGLENANRNEDCAVG